jgi:hypothetical protein
MPGDFQAYNSLKTSSKQALDRIKIAVELALGHGDALQFEKGVTVVDGTRSQLG